MTWKPHVQKVKTQLSRACGIISKLKHYTTPPVLKVVYNSLIHPYLNYSILNWGRASNATIQPLIKLQNKAIKIINPTNMESLEDHFQHLNILCLPKLYSFPEANSCTLIITNCFQIILMNILFHSAQLIITPQGKQPLKTCFYIELTLPQENVLLNLLAQKYGLQYQTILNLTTFTFKWKPKKQLLHEQNSQLWTLATFHLSNKLL